MKVVGFHLREQRETCREVGWEWLVFGGRVERRNFRWSWMRSVGLSRWENRIIFRLRFEREWLDLVDEKRQTSNEFRRELLVSVEEKRQTSCEVGQELLVLVNEKGKILGWSWTRIVGFYGRELKKLQVKLDESGRFWWTRKQKLPVNLDDIGGYGGRKKTNSQLKLDEMVGFGGQEQRNLGWSWTRKVAFCG